MNSKLKPKHDGARSLNKVFVCIQFTRKWSKSRRRIVEDEMPGVRKTRDDQDQDRGKRYRSFYQFVILK
jgi:hypothetical protein